MDDWELWIWRGIRLELPADWEMLQFQRDPERGRCGFADAFQMRAELTWRRLSPKEPGAEPHPLKMRDDYVAWLKTAGVRQIQPSSPTATETKGWLGARGIAHGQAFSNHSRWFGEEGMLLELFLWLREEEEDAALESRTLAGCRPVTADSADAGRWRAFGLDVRTDLHLQRCEVYPGLARMAFALRDDPEPFFAGNGGGGERLLVERRGLARHWVAEDTLLATWNRAQVPTGLRRDGGKFETGGDDRVTCAWVAGIPRRSPVLALAQNVRALILRRAWPRPAFLSIACAIPARNELRRAEFWTTLGPPEPEAAARQILPASEYREVTLPSLPHGFQITPDSECSLPPPATWTALLSALPIRNAAAEIEPSGGPGLHLRLRNARPAWFRPPLSWVLPRRPFRRFALDELGAALWRRCDGQTPVVEIIADFAHAHQTTFHEARVVVSQHLQTLTARGLIALAQGEADGGRAEPTA